MIQFPSPNPILPKNHATNSIVVLIICPFSIYKIGMKTKTNNNNSAPIEILAPFFFIPHWILQKLMN